MKFYKRLYRTRRIPDAGKIPEIIKNYLLLACFVLLLFYLSLLLTSAPFAPADRAVIERAVALLEEKGFEHEVFLLRHLTTFRSADNWLNRFAEKENAFAATNFPFGVMTIYPDFFNKTRDDPERAMILLHEIQHIQGKNEAQAYEYVWHSRHRLGWTTLSHGTSPTFVTIELQTREYAPHLFICPEKVWDDCTETLYVKTEARAKTEARP